MASTNMTTKLAHKKLAKQRLKALISLQFKLWRRNLASNPAYIIMGLIFTIYGLCGAILCGLLVYGSIRDGYYLTLSAACAGGFIIYQIIVFMMPSAEGRLLPEQYAHLPLTSADLSLPALICSTFQLRAILALLCTVATTIGAGLALGSIGLGWAIVPLIIAMLACLVLTLLAGELVALAISHVTSRRSKEFLSALGLILFVGLSMSFYLFSPKEGEEFSFQISDLATASQIGAWTFGAGPAAALNLATGQWLVGLGQLFVTVGLFVLSVLGWRKLLSQGLIAPLQKAVRKEKKTKRPSGVPVLIPGFRYASGQMIFSRSLRYFARDPRLLMSLAVFPVLLVFVLVTPFNEAFMFMGPYFGYFFAISPALFASNIFGYDGPSNWLHLNAPLKTSTLLISRMLAMILPCLILALAGVSALAWRLPDKGLLPFIIATAVGAFISSIAVGLWLSVYNPYPMAKPGTNPWRDKSGFSSGAFLASIGSMFGSLVPIAPGLIVMLLGRSNAMAFVVGVVLTVIVPIILVLIVFYFSNRRLSTHFPEIFAKVARYV